MPPAGKLRVARTSDVTAPRLAASEARVLAALGGERELASLVDKGAPLEPQAATIARGFAGVAFWPELVLDEVGS